MATILVVDDEEKMREVLAMALEGLGHRPLAASDGGAALEVLEAEPVDAVLTDLRMPALNGRELLDAIRERWPDVPVVLMTAYATVKDAVRCIQHGAFDYLSKPFEMDELEKVLANALKLSGALRENRRLREELRLQSTESLLGDSPRFRTVLRAVREVAPSSATVLVTGESGTGKELVARAIHLASSRRERPFVALNCAAIPEGLLESELFGHVRGAFSGAVSNRTGRFEQADGGTLFLDEIGDMPITLQAKILRALQDQRVEPVGSDKSRKVDVRIIAATNRDLREGIQKGTFREDLFYRLNVYPIEIPPLRERPEDVPLLATHFAHEIAPSMGKRIEGFTEAALEALKRHPWPGNVRELRNYVERAIISARRSLLDVGDLPPDLRENRTGSQTPGGLPLDERLEQLEREWILEALQECQGVQVRAAERLGITERSLWHRVKKLGIQIVKEGR